MWLFSKECFHVSAHEISENVINLLLLINNINYS